MSNLDALWLLLNLKKVISGIDKKDNARVTYHDALAALYKMKQGQDESNSEYLERFRSIVNSAELAQASNVFCSPALMEVAQDGKPTDQDINDEEEASMAILLLKNSDPKRYSSLSKKLREGTFLSRDEYPVTVSTMYEFMTNHDKLYHTQGSGSNRNNRGIILTQQRANSGNSGSGGSEDVYAATVAGIDGNIINATCYFCNLSGHLS